MKRIYLLLVALTLATGVFAQRSVNLEVSMVKPTSSTVVNWGGGFDYDVVVKNLGPDSLKGTSVTDSILWFASISGTPISFTFGSVSGVYWLRFNRALKVNDTMHFKASGLSFSFEQEVDSNRTFCFYAYPRGKANDTIADPATTNNRACATFMYKRNKFPASVNTVSENGNNFAVVYPNPANDVTNISITTDLAADVRVRVMDISGRLVIDENKGFLNRGTHSFPLNTRNLSDGLYIYQVMVGDDMIKGKFSIAK